MMCSLFFIPESTIGENNSSATIYFSGEIVASSPSPTPTTVAGIHAQGTKLLDRYGNEVVFNGVVSRPLFGWSMYPVTTYLTSGDVQTIRNHNVNYLRVFISLSMAVRDQPEGTPTHMNYNPLFWQKLDDVANSAKQNGIWLSITVGVDDGYWANIGGEGNGFPDWMYNGSWNPYFTKTYTNDAAGTTAAIRDFWNTSDPVAESVRTAYKTFWSDIVTRYKDAPNIMFNFFNEPLSTWGGPTLYPITDYNNPDANWSNLATMFRGFMEQMIDQTCAIDDVNHICIIGAGDFPNHAWNLQVRRPNILVEDHNYKTPIIDRITQRAGYAFRYNQPFLLGEFGGIEDGGGDKQSAADTTLTMQTCNSLGISWSYLRFSYTPAPSASTWSLLESQLTLNARFYTP